MKGLGDLSQHRCIKHLESNRCVGEPSRHTMAIMMVKILNTRRGLGDPSQHRFDNIDIKKVIDIWPGESSRQI